MIRFNPLTCTLRKNNNNVKMIIDILKQYDYHKQIRRTPQIYATEFNELENYFAIENTVPNLLVESNNNLEYKVPESHYSAFDIKYYIRKYNPDQILVGNKHEQYNGGRMYKNCLLTRLWFERKPEITEVRVLMEQGSFHYSYLMTINHAHTFEESKNNEWAKRLECTC